MAHPAAVEAMGWWSCPPSCRLACLYQTLVGNQRFVEARKHVQHDITVRLLVHALRNSAEPGSPLVYQPICLRAMFTPV